MFVAVIVPHASVMLDMLAPRPRKAWLANDVEVLCRCDAVLRLPGRSPGADLECREAELRSIPVFLGLAALLDWRASRQSSRASSPATVPQGLPTYPLGGPPLQPLRSFPPAAASVVPPSADAALSRNGDA